MPRNSLSHTFFASCLYSHVEKPVLNRVKPLPSTLTHTAFYSHSHGFHLSCPRFDFRHKMQNTWTRLSRSVCLNFLFWLLLPLKWVLGTLPSTEANGKNFHRLTRSCFVRSWIQAFRVALQQPKGNHRHGRAGGKTPSFAAYVLDAINCYSQAQSPKTETWQVVAKTKPARVGGQRTFADLALKNDGSLISALQNWQLLRYHCFVTRT